MRLRKTMKRTAAAVLALSMAVSAAALPASAGFNIDMSKVDGDVEITQVDDNGSAKVTIKVGGVEKTNDFSDGKEGNDVTITGDNTKPTESQNAEEENTSEAEKSGENTSEVEKTGEDTAEAEKTGKTEEQAQEPALWSCWPRRTRRSRPRRRRLRRSPPTLRSRSRPKRPPIR